MNNEENVNQNDARAILDGSNGKHKICLLSIIGEVEGHENLSEIGRASCRERV